MSDRHRFERIYVDYYDSVLRYCLRRTTREQALDATADTFVVAWRRRADMPAGRELPWLYGVARRVLANQRRTSDRYQSAVVRMRVATSPPGNQPEVQVVQQQETRDVLAALARLPASDREIIRLAGWEELDREQLATATDSTPNAVTKRLNRALDHLAHELGIEERPAGRFFQRGRVAK